MNTIADTGNITPRLLNNYLTSLVNCFFKILPMRESGEKSVDKYIKSLQAELLGCRGLVQILNDDSRYLSLLSILQYLSDNPELPVETVKREVFKGIRLCNALKERYGEAHSDEPLAHI